MPIAAIKLDVTYRKMLLRGIFISPAHNYFGHYGREAGLNPTVSLSEVECVPGRGLRGDRFFDYKENYKGQVTFFSLEVYEELKSLFPMAASKPPSVFRRNLVVSGSDLNSLIGIEFELQGIRFFGASECSPCEWMDQAFHPGTEAALKHRGGLRARILTGGLLRVDHP